MSARAARPAAVALLALLALALLAPSAAAQDAGWVIESFDADIVVTEDGDLEVTERLAVDFRDLPSRGIFRHLPIRSRVDDDTVRRFGLDRVRVSTSEGTPDDVDQERSFTEVVIRVGDPDVSLTGRHTYEISYRYRGVLNRFDDHDELWWNVTGDAWETEIAQVRTRVRTPAEVQAVTCYEGRAGATDPCASAAADGQVATFTGGPLAPGEQVDVVVDLPPGAVDVAEPDLEPASTLARLFSPSPSRLAGGSLVGLLGAVGLVGLYRRGRDADAPAAAGGVEYRPPLGLRPAQLRTLLTQRVDATSISATLVDLAVRGHLRIEEVEPEGVLSRFRSSDWRLVRTVNPEDPLRAHEKHLLVGLFGAPTLELEGQADDEADPTLGADAAEQARLDDTGERVAAADEAEGSTAVLAGWLQRALTPTEGRGRASVLMSSLGDGEFEPHAKRMEQALYGDVVRRGYFARSPVTVRGAARAISLAVLAVGVGGLIATAATYGDWGLVLAPLVVIGLGGLALSRWAPRRTAKGAEVNARAKGFREFIETAEADRMAFAEREQLFAAYLPYAMAFECVDRWADAFAALGVAAPAAAGGWYVASRTSSMSDFGRSLSSFSSTAGSTMRESASSSGGSGSGGGGSAGGGGGGGGGGRW
ncbi:MAG: DUF2207 domain-containing protein [Egibacteraceae bacterium]